VDFRNLNYNCGQFDPRHTQTKISLKKFIHNFLTYPAYRQTYMNKQTKQAKCITFLVEETNVPVHYMMTQ